MMTSPPRSTQPLRSFFRKDPLDRELDEEMASHLEMAIEENMRRGLSPEEARRHALVQFGGVQQAREQHREVARTSMARRPDAGPAVHLPHIAARPRVRDCCRADSWAWHWRQFAVFSVVNTILLRPLPFPARNSWCGLSRKTEIRRIEQNVHSGCDAGLSATEPFFSVRKRILRLYRAG